MAASIPAEDLLVSADQLHASLNDSNLRIVDCRWNLVDPNEGTASYAEAHIPGAQYAALEPDLSDPAGTSGRHPLPTKARFKKVLEKLGVANDSVVVAYDDGTSVYACRFWWMLRWMGHRQVRVLDGGMHQWLASEFETTDVCVQPQRTEFKIGEQLTKVRTVAEILDSKELLIDARTHERFQGQNETLDHTAGHIPGAVCYPFQENLNSDMTFKRPTERFRSLDSSKSMVCYCGSGVSATNNIMALLLAGCSEPALYPGSWSEWIENPARPIQADD